jgi:hypothetical protein
MFNLFPLPIELVSSVGIPKVQVYVQSIPTTNWVAKTPLERGGEDHEVELPGPPINHLLNIINHLFKMC